MASSSQSWKDPYVDDISGCLKNKLKIIDSKRLSRIESTLSSIRMFELTSQPLQKKFDLEHLKATHKYIFQDIYPWAGEIRTVDLQKGATHFLPHSLIERGAHYLFDQLEREKQLQGLSPDDFSQRAGHYLGEINHLHPFREGNGRTQRSFINQLAAKGDYFITWEKANQERMIEASIQANDGDSKMIAQIIKDNLVDRDYILAIEKYGDQGQRKIQQAEQGKSYDGPIIGLTKRYVIQEIKERSFQFIAHHRSHLAHEVKASSHKDILIKYPYDKIGLVYENEKEIHQEHDKTSHQKKEDREKEKIGKKRSLSMSDKKFKSKTAQSHCRVHFLRHKKIKS